MGGPAKNGKKEHSGFYDLRIAAFRDILVWCPSCTCAVFSSKISSKIVSVCFQYRESVSNTVIPDTQGLHLRPVTGNFRLPLNHK